MTTETINRIELYGDIYTGFVEETSEQLQDVEDLILNMEHSLGNDDHINVIFRIMHNIKGAAGCFAFENLTRIAHLAESLLGQLKDGKRSASQELTDSLLEVVDIIKQMFADDDDQVVGNEKVIRQLQMLVDSSDRRTEAHLDEPSTKGSDQADEAAPQTTVMTPASTVASAKKKEPLQQSIRLPVMVLDELLELIGEVVLGRNQLLKGNRDNPVFSGLSNSITKLHRHVIQTRMQPVGTVFQRYNRMMRDLSLQTDKKIALTIEGDEIELDRTLLEKLSDPLTHLLRNAADHGLETTDERIAAGKPTEGNISLRAYLETGQIIIEVQDDGKGMDENRILAKAFDMGLVTTEQVSTFSREEILGLVFLPGFSTKDQANELSGRGVGMDVVKTNLESLGFSLEITSKPGKGTCFSARMPQTQAIVNSSVISALIIGHSGYQIAIPETAVSEMFTLTKEQLKTELSTVNGQQIIRFRGSSMPLLSLSGSLSSATEAQPGRRGRGLFIMIQFKKSVFAIQIDEILGTEEIVVKRLPQLLKSRRLFEGATILSGGAVAMILNINGLVEQSGLRFEQQSIRNLQSIAEKSLAEESNEVLLLQLANQEQVALPLDLVAGIHKISHQDIQRLGHQEYAQINGRNLQLVRLDQFLDCTAIEPRDSYFIVETQQESPVGILGCRLTGHINFSDASALSEAAEEGILGYFYWENKLITLLDLHGLRQARQVTESVKIEDSLLHSCRLLLVEDTLFYRHFLLKFFQALGFHQIISVSNGIEALETISAETENYDLIISDIEMPVMGGLELAATLKSDPKYRDIPLLALTGLNQESDRQKALEAGFDKFELKLNKKNILSSVEGLLLKAQEEQP